MTSTCFGLRPSSGSLQLSLAKVTLILKHSLRLQPNFLCSGVAVRPGVMCVLCAVLCTAHRTHVTLGHAAKPPNNNLAECLNINTNLARLNCKLPDDGRRPKHVEVM